MQWRLQGAIASGIVGDDLRGVHQGHAPELAHVDEVEGRAVGEREGRAGEPLWGGLAQLFEREPSGHPQRRAERVAAIQQEHHELAAAANGLDPPAGQARSHERHRLGLGDPLPVGCERGDRPAGHALGQLSRDRLDLG